MNTRSALRWGVCAFVLAGALPPRAAPAEAAAEGFKTVEDRGEGAIRVSVPKSWHARVVLHRVRPTEKSGPAAEEQLLLGIDVASPDRKVKLQLLPELFFFDPERAPAQSRPSGGSRHLGMMIQPLPAASDFLLERAFPYAQPQARSPQVQDTRSAPDLARQFAQSDGRRGPRPVSAFDASVVRLRYEERGIQYEARLVGVLEELGGADAGVWRNRDTVFVRAPSDEFERYAPTLRRILASISLDPQWLEREAKREIERDRGGAGASGDPAQMAARAQEQHEQTLGLLEDALFPEARAGDKGAAE